MRESMSIRQSGIEPHFPTEHLAGTRQTVQFLHSVCVNFYFHCSHILFEMLNFGSPWDREHNWRSRQQPCQSHLGWRSFPLRCDATNSAIRTGNTTCSQRKPRDKTHFLFLAVLQNIFRSAVG